MSLLTELQTLKDSPHIYGADGPLGLRSEFQQHVTSAVETLADMAFFVLSQPADDEEAKSRQRAKYQLLEQEIAVKINAYPVFRTDQTEEEEKQGIRGRIFLIYRDEAGVETKRTLWKLIVDFKPEEE